MEFARRGQFVATVAANVPLCREHFRLELWLPRFPASRPGQFIQVAGDDILTNPESRHELDWRPGEAVHVEGVELLEAAAMLRRPFSLAGRFDVDGGVELHVIHRVVGLATRWLANLRGGDRVGILGPLGNAFELPGKGGTALLVGGGVGIPPMIYLAGAMKGIAAVAFSGAQSRDLVPLKIIREGASNDAEPRMCVGEFAEHGIAAVVATDDGSLGVRGYVTDALETYLDSHSPVSPTIYVCGPEIMMKKVAGIAARRGIACQVAVERAMACGMGTCQSCCIRVRKPDPSLPPLPGREWCYRLACTDGPIFRGTDLLW